MLLTNWLRSISNRCRPLRKRKTSQQRRLRCLSAASLSHALSTRESITQTEVLEDRTLLTSEFSISADFRIDEGDSGDTIATFTITREGSYAGSLNSVASVNFHTQDDTALSGEGDYVPVSTTVTFGADSSSLKQTQTVEVIINGDLLVEEEEKFKGILSNNSSGTTISSSTRDLRIANDDQARISINDVTVNEAAGTVEVTVSIDKPVDNFVRVFYATVADTATNDDFGGKVGFINFDNGEQSKTLSFNITDDELYESEESFQVQLTGLQFNTYDVFIADDLGVVTIEPDDDFVHQFELQSKLFTPGISNSYDEYGRSFAVDNDTMIVSSRGWDEAGENAGAAFIYTRNDQGTPAVFSDDTWGYQATLLPPAGYTTDGFGFTVSIAGDIAVVTDYLDDEGAENSGAIYVYTRSNNVWTFQQKLKASDPEEYSRFGTTLVVENDTIFVGVETASGENLSGYYDPYSTQEQGAVYIFTRSGNTWSESVRLTASDPEQQKHFGSSIDVEGSILVVGADSDSNDQTHYASGAVYVYELQDGNWIEVQKLHASSIQDLANFGSSVALDGNNLVIGADSQDVLHPELGQLENIGAAFVFTRVDDVWQETQMLTILPDDFQASLGIGLNVDIQDDLILVNSQRDPAYLTGTYNGATYVFRKGGETWIQVDRLGDIDIDAFSYYGRDSVISNDLIMINAMRDSEQAEAAGAIYVYRPTDLPIISIDNMSFTEGDTGSKYVTIEVTRTSTTPGDLSIPAQVNFATMDGDAKITTGDYLGNSGTLTFESDSDALSQTKTFTIQIFGDTFVEKNETILVTLSNSLGSARLLERTATITIIEDDQSLVRIDDISVHENDGTATIYVSLDKPVNATVNIDYSTANRTAYATADYISLSGTITFTAGTQSQAITIPIVNNSQVEAEESFYVNLSHIQSEGANVAFSDSQGEISIQDDDQTIIPLLSIDDLAVNEDAGTATLHVSLSSAIPTTVSVDYITANGTAVSSNDYLARSGTVTFNPLETSQTITIPIFDSAIVEDDETFFVFLDNIQSGVYQVLMNDDQALVTILEKTRPRLTISDLSINEGAGTATLAVNLSKAQAEAVSIEYATADDSAHSTTDFESSTGLVTFAAGETTKTIEIILTNDNLVEVDESFLVNLFNLQDGSLNVGVLDSQARVTIRDNDQATISVDDITVNEDAGTAVLQVTLSAPVDGDVFVDFATADQSATSSDDYVETTGTLQFHAGEQVKTITVPIVNSTPLEAYQSFLVKLGHLQSNGMIVTIADSQAEVTIIDSIALRLSIDNVMVDEAEGTATLYVSLNQAIDSPFSVDFHTDSHTALPTSDYTETSGTLFFASQQTTKVITIPLVNDDVIEPDEIFLVSLENIQSLDYLIEFEDDQAFVKIEDDDTPPLKISDDSDFVLQQRLSADPANANHSQDYFGRIVAIDGDTMVVGVPDLLLSSTTIYPDSGPGAVYVYTRNQNGTATDKTDDTWDFQTALTPDPFQENHFSFGSSISMSGDTIVVGAKHESAGTVYIFTRSGSDWTSQPPQVESVTIQDLYNTAQFGSAVAIYEDAIVVGAEGGRTGTVNSGAAYILEKQGETWAAPKISEIKPSDLHSSDAFGNAVAIHGDLIVVGARYAGPNGYWSGAAYVVTKNGADWSTLSPTIAKLLPRNGTELGRFGSKVATNGVDVAISSVKKDSNSYAIGSVQIFTRNGTDWSTLDPTEVKFYSGIQYDEFGSDLALTADRLIVGATGDILGATGDSKTYIYHKTTSSWYSATLDQVISHGVGSNTKFGFGVATSGSTIVIGAPGDDSVSSNSGSIITYEKTGSNNWAQSDELLPGENQPSHNGDDLFGNHIAIDGDYMVVSAAGTDSSLAPDGIVYLYSRNDQGTPDVDSDDTWDFVRSLLPPDPSAVTGFGLGVAIDDGTILIGARLTSGNYEVYIYERNGADWTLLPPKVSPLLSKYNYKNSDGFTLAVSGDTIVIGQPKATGNFSNSGVISVYTKRGSDWSTLSPVETVLYADDGSYGDYFGQSIDIDGDRIIVGAPEKGDTGAVYLFEKGSTSWRTTATQRRLTINEPLTYERLGKAVSIEGDLVAVAAKYDDVSTPNGVVYLLDSSTGWDQPVQTTFSASETNLTLYYGDHIDLSGQTLVVGNGSTGSRAGLYIYDGSSGWDSLNGTRLSLNPDAREYRSFFASEFAVSGNNIVSYASTGSPRAIGEVYVINRRPLPEISIEDASIVEGNAGTQSLQLTVTLTGSSLDLFPGNNVSLAFATSDGTATTADNDYQSQTGTLSFDTSSGASSYTKTILINITGDTNPESDEYFFVSLSDPSVPVLLRKRKAKVTIENDDQVHITIDDLTVHSDAQTANVTVSLNKQIDVPVSIDFTTVDQTAFNTVDYQAITGTLTFSAGETSKTISIPVLNPSQIEANKTFLVNLFNLQTSIPGVVLTDSQAQVTIVDANQPTLSFNDITVDEDAGTATIIVTLNQALTSALTVNYATADGSASSGSDYQSNTGTLTFDPGETTQSIQITINDSDMTELDETFLVNLYDPQSAGFQPTLADSQAVVTIEDNDPGFLSINDITVDEAAGIALLTVSLDHAASKAISIDYATADDSASSGSDYQSRSGTLTFNPGDTTQTIAITLIDSDLVETDENFLVNLSNLQVAGLDVSLPDTQAVVTIQDDDRASLSIQDISVDEDAGTALLTISLDQTLLTSITVDFETLEGTALVDSDYSAKSGTLTFDPGETTQTITLTILNDTIGELPESESFFVKLTNLQTNGSPVDLITDQAEITILDDDYANLSISDAEVNEATGTATLIVTLEKALDIAFSIDYQTNDGTAIVNSDYLESSGTLTFNPGDVSKTIQVSILDTDYVESAETLQVQLSNLQGAGTSVFLVDPLGEISIQDNDQAALSIEDVSVDENAGTARLTVSLNQIVETTVVVDYATSDQTASDGTDYLNISGTLTFNVGETTKTITVNLIDSDLIEADETLLVNLSQLQSGADVVFAGNQGVVTIVDDDQATLSLQDLIVNEAAGKVLMTVSLDKPVDSTVTVDFSTIDQSATSPNDYLSQTGILSFAPGTMHQTIEIDLVDSAQVELPETFDVQLSNLQAGGLNVVIPDDRAAVTLKDDDLGDYEFKHKLYPVGTQDLNDQFSYGVAVDGDTMISSALFWNATYAGQGSAFIYVRNDQGTPEYTGDDTWNYQDTLLAPDADNIPDRFGWSVAISGDTAVVSAPLGDGIAEDMGSVYVYTRSNGSWTLQQELNVNDTIDSHFFGDVVVIEGDTIVVGARATENYTGSAYVFQRTDGVWTKTAKLVADDPAESANFGNAIDIENSTIVIGARFDSETQYRSGAVYIFSEQAGSWTQTLKLKDTSPSNLGSFGSSVSLAGELLLVGATSSTNQLASAGKAILYRHDLESGAWNPIQTLRASDATQNAFFGADVKIKEGQILINSGADPTGPSNNGALYLFKRENQTWVEQQKISSPDAETGDQFGRHFAIADDTIFIGAQYDNDGALNAGSVYVYGLPQNPDITIEDVSVSEENDGSRLITASVTRTATKPGDLIYGATVDFRTVDGTATVVDGDYESTTGTITFDSDPDASSQTQTISIRVYGDTLLESDETFGIELLNVTGHAQISDPQATVTIQNDDQATLWIDDISINEGSGLARVTVYLSQPLSSSVSVEYATADQTADSASDYTSVNGTLTFDPGVQLQTIDISIIDSDLVELDETFFINLSNLQTSDSNVILGDFQGEVSILNDDQARFVLDDLYVREDVGNALVTVSLDKAVDTTVSVFYIAQDVTTDDRDDFLSSYGTLIFNPGEQQKTISIPIVDSDLVERDERFEFSIGTLEANGRDVSLEDNSMNVWILDDDQAQISINDVIVNEGDGTATLTISMDREVTDTISFDYTTVDQTAGDPDDYQATSGTLTLNPNEQTKTITVSLTKSDLIELDETFLVNLTNLESGNLDVVIADSQGQVTIQDDSQAKVSINDITVFEDAGMATLTVTLDHAVAGTFSLDYTLSDLTALSTSDYLDTTGTLTFLSGEQLKTISVSIIDSEYYENDETFQVQLSQLHANGFSILLEDSLGEVTIIDDASASAELQLRVVDTPTVTEFSGEADALPPHLTHLREWDTYWVELWIDTSAPANQGIFSAGLDLRYETALTSATEIEFGDGFSSNQSASIDDQAGIVSGIYAETNADHLGSERFLLFARLKFEPLTTDQVSVDLNGKSIGPYNLGFEISSQEVSLSGGVPVNTSVAPSSQTGIWANPFDFNDDDIINYRDLILMVSVYGHMPSESDSQVAWISDLNQDDKVNYRDLIMLVGNYGIRKNDNNSVNYPANYPNTWNQKLLVNPLTEAKPDPETVTQSAAENTLNSIVDQIQPQLDPVQQETVEQVSIKVVDLQGDALGHALANTIYIDVNAAGYGWFIDATPFDHSEFEYSSDLTLIALEDGPAANQIDLWTVILHELGHILGVDHEAEGVMQETLDPGVRKLPGFNEALSEVSLRPENEIDDFFSTMTEEIDLIVL
ncbi:Calx-beta domain-containing protein [Gimesia sp.]|uniref:Calx-beta domain-containing protein n=1 Tax=Gimesia sp. TaxID=2024833 RepID=UPI003A8E91FF